MNKYHSIIKEDTMQHVNRREFLQKSAVSATTLSLSKQQYTLSTMPRVDVHAHYGNLQQIDGMMQVSDLLKEQYKINLDIWINLNPFLPVGNPKEISIEFHEEVGKKYNGRILSCISDYDVTNGFRYSPEEIVEWQKRGVVGYKIWAPIVLGPTPPAEDRFTIWAPDYPGLDNPANDPTFSTMARIGLVGASIHIAQAHPRRWENPVHFWATINSWVRVLDKHPDMVVVMAHMFNLFYTDEQLDYLRYILETYPNVYLDIGGRFGDIHSMNREHVRDFMINYADRIVFGTDVSSQAENGEYQKTAERYIRSFQILETDKICYGGFFGEHLPKQKGLALPLDVLEKIYFRTAAKIYPRIKDVLISMGYVL